MAAFIGKPTPTHRPPLRLFLFSLMAAAFMAGNAATGAEEDTSVKAGYSALEPVEPAGNRITVDGFTGEDIRSAIDQAAPGDEIFFPAGKYRVKETIVIDKPIIMRGAAKLQNVAVVEWDGDNVPPEWEGEPSELTYDSSVPYDFDMFQLRAESARLEDLRFVGGLVDQDGFSRDDLRTNGVQAFTGHLEVNGCEFTRHSQALRLASEKTDKAVVVRNSYFHENFRRASGYGVASASYGRGLMDVRECEFKRNRHCVVGSTELDMVIIDNYFHTNDPVVEEYSIDIHPAAGYRGRMIVRGNVMMNTGGVVYHSGTGEVTGNYFGPYDQYHPILIGARGIPNFMRNCKPHNIYIGRNTNDYGRDYLAYVRSWEWLDGETKLFGFNVYEDGVLYEAVNDEFPTYETDPRPKLGDVYITEIDGEEAVKTIERGTWYDLHAMAVDPQGAETIRKVGLQIRTGDNDYAPGNREGTFRKDGNYFLETDGETVFVRDTEGSAVWTELTEGGTFADPEEKLAFEDNGSHRKQLTIRFRVPEDAPSGRWHLNGYVEDNDGNIPMEMEYLEQIAWEIAAE